MGKNISWEEAVKRNRANLWEIHSRISGSTVILSVIQGMTTLTNTDIFVNPPNWFERQLGLTHKSKIEKGVCRQKVKCRKLNAIDVKTRNLEPAIEKMLTDCEVK